MTERSIKHKTGNSKTINFDTVENLAKRYGIVLKASLKDRDRILKAAARIDSLREKFGSGEKKSNAVKIIRRIRKER